MVRKWLKYWLTYNPIREYRSPINGPMKVVMVMNMPRLIVGNMIQSGGLVRQIWDKAIGKIKKENLAVEKALIIGLGCGDCAFRIHKHYPKAKMVGVEIDAQIIDAAECYFNLAILKNLKVAIDDGISYTDKLLNRKKKTTFDLIVVDVYLGRDIPSPFKQKAFFKKLKKLLTHQGVVIYNHLFFAEHKKEAKEVVDKLSTVFTKVSLQRTASNLLIFAR
jgi:spermidine synthase